MGQVNDIQKDEVNLEAVGIANTDVNDASSTAVTGEHIKAYTTQVEVQKDGTIKVNENIIYDFSSLSKHGIYRTIPTQKTNKDGKKFQLHFSNFSVVDEKNIPYTYFTQYLQGEIKLKIGNANKLITGIHTYNISYLVSGALTYFSDHDELYWNTTGNEWNVPIAQAMAKIKLPNEIKEADITLACFTGSQNSTASLCKTAKVDSATGVISTNVLTANQGLTIVISFPKNHIAVLEPKEVVPFSATLLGKLFSLAMILLATFWYLIYPIKIIIDWFRSGRDPKGIIGETRAWFDPPKTPSGKRFMTPAEVGTLGDETVDLKDISAMIIDLARRGYLKIEERKKKDFYFVKINSGPIKISEDFQGKQARMTKDILLPFEKKLLAGIFEDSDEIRLKDAELYETIEDVKKDLYETVVDEKLFPKNPQSIRTFYSTIGGMALFTFNFFLAAVAFIFGRNMPKKTVEGVNAFNVAKSLKNFLTSQERQLAFQADKQMMFEKLLPYAVAFGVEKIWAKRFETMNLKQPDWYQGYGQTQFNSVIFANSMSSSFSSFRSAATPTSSSSGFSSGFSGGSSGGGGGGGGGGSW